MAWCPKHECPDMVCCHLPHEESEMDAGPTEHQQLIAMLTRVGVGYGTRHDHNPEGVAVQVECDDSDDARQWTVTEFVFDADGRLKTVVCYEPEDG